VDKGVDKVVIRDEASRPTILVVHMIIIGQHVVVVVVNKLRMMAFTCPPTFSIA
jgi:hypothetical protein